MLPKTVVTKDHELSKAADDLMKLRWHWTLDESNSKRVTFSEYARQVGKSEAVIRRDAKAWAKWLEANRPTSDEVVDPDTGKTRRKPVKSPNAPRWEGKEKAKSPSDFRELSKISETKQLAAEAIAKASGRKIATVIAHSRNEIDNVINMATANAERQGTTVESEIEFWAEKLEKRKQTQKKQRDAQKKRHTSQFIKIESELGKAIFSLRQALNESHEVDFSDEERELLKHTLGKVSSLFHLVELRIAGDTEIDWDAELAKLGGEE